MSGPTHPLIQTMDRIAALPLPPQKKLLLHCLARHSDWDTLTSAHPSMGTLTAWTGLSKRRVQRLLGEMVCDSPRPRRMQMPLGDDVVAYEPCGRCEKVDDRGRPIAGDDLLLVARAARGHDSPSYSLFVAERAEQLALPDVGRFTRTANAPSREQPERLTRVI